MMTSQVTYVPDFLFPLSHKVSGTLYWPVVPSSGQHISTIQHKYKTKCLTQALNNSLQYNM